MTIESVSSWLGEMGHLFSKLPEGSKVMGGVLISLVSVCLILLYFSPRPVRRVNDGRRRGKE